MALNIENIIAEIKEASILELNDLVKAIEEEFGVTAAAPVAAAAAGAGQAVHLSGPLTKITQSNTSSFTLFPSESSGRQLLSAVRCAF